MMIRFFLLAVLFLASLSIEAQESVIKRNATYIELAGAGLLYSVNYDRLIIVDEKMRFSTTVGAWYIPHIESISDFKYMVGSTLGLNTLLGKKTHFAELGINLSYMNMKDTEDSYYQTVFLPIRLGYRYQKDEGGLFIRASFMPIISVLQDADAEFLYPVTPHFSLGLGYSF